MRDTKEYWQDIHDQVENMIYKGHAIAVGFGCSNLVNGCSTNAHKKSRSANYGK